MPPATPTPGFWISLALHATVLAVGMLLFSSKVEFAMDSGKNSVEVNLVAAAPEPQPTPTPPPTITPEVQETPEPPKPDDMVVPTAQPTPPATPLPPTPEPPTAAPPTPPAPKTVVKHTVKKGDGSSPKPGNDATNLATESGSLPTMKPDYLRNPAPVYPEQARQEKQEGRVVLVVVVNAEGQPDSVEVSQTSGFNLLDESAQKAVRGWRFRPATLAGFNVKARVFVPVRFRLDN
jgi:protein TonB